MSAHDVDAGFGRITPAAVERLQSLIGQAVPIEQPYLRLVNQDSIAHVARALGDRNPLYADPAHARSSRYGALIAPPALLYGVAWGSWDLRRGLQIPGVTALHAGDSWRYLRPVLDGDTLTATKTTTGCDLTTSRGGAPRVLQTDRIDIRNQRRELVAVQEMSTIRVERVGDGTSAAASGAQKAKYSAGELDALDAEVLSETPRGATTRYWEDVAVGDQLDPVVRGPLALADVMAWVQAVGSAHVRSGRFWVECRRESPQLSYVDDCGVPQQLERMHWDEAAAAGSGVPTSAPGTRPTPRRGGPAMTAGWPHWMSSTAEWSSTATSCASPARSSTVGAGPGQAPDTSPSTSPQVPTARRTSCPAL